MSRTNFMVPEEFEPSKFDCIAKFSWAGKFTLKYQSFEMDFDFEISKVDYIPLIPGVFSNSLR